MGLRPIFNNNNHDDEDLGYCPNHPNEKLRRGFLGNPRCYQCDYETLMRMGKEFDRKVAGQMQASKLEEESLADNRLVFKATFDNFRADPGTKEEWLRNKIFMAAQDLVANPQKACTMILTGPPGAGKTHLAMAALKYVQSKGGQNCLFININTLLSHIKSSFNDPTEFWTESKAIAKMRGADLLCIDDLGTESAMASTGEATNFVQNILYKTLDSQQRVIITTNLSEEKMKQVYNAKNVSRVFKHSYGTKYDFSGIKDKRRG